MRGLKLHGFGVLLLLVNIVIVLGLFKIIESRETAGLTAGILFLLSGGFICFTEYTRARALNSWAFWASLAFLLFAALPIMGLRLVHPGVEFAELSLLGIPGPAFHKISSWLFIAMWAAVGAEAIRDLRGREKPTLAN